MPYSLRKINKAISIMKSYKGNNPYISYISECYEKGYRTLNDFDIDYIINNKDFEPFFVKKTFKIADWFGVKLSEKLQTDFLIEKVNIIKVIGKIKNSIHCYIRYRKSIKEPILVYIPIKAIYGDVFEKDYHDIDIDFNKYNKITENIGRKLKPHQEEAVKFLVSRKKAILADEQGLGKELPFDTVIPTINGFKMLKDIEIGDKIFSSYGDICTVLGVFNQGKKDVYEITFNDGIKCKSGLNHLWITKNINELEYKVLPLSDIIKSNNLKQYEIPICSSLKCEDNGIKIEDYLSYYKNNNLDSLKNIIYDSANKKKHFIKNIIKNQENKLYIESTNNDMNIILGDLILSIGGSFKIKQYDNKFLIFFYGLYDKENIEFKFNRTFKRIKKLKEKKESICLKVDSKDGSFITENFVVTHNTTTTVVSSIEGGFKKILIICPCSLKGTWKRELMYYINKDDINVINGKKWGETKKYNIINYDILQNFYVLPTEIEYETVEDNEGNLVERPKLITKNGKKIEKYKKSTNRKFIKECMLKSRLYLEQFDLVIIDEIQKLANNTSTRYKILDDFLRRSNPKSIYCITGTPLTNRPFNLYHILKLIDADIVKDYKYYTERFCEAKKIEKQDGSVIITKNGASNLDELREKIKNLYIRRLQKDIPGIVKKTIFTRYYSLDEDDRNEYEKLWHEYKKSQNITDSYEVEKHRELIEGGLVRRYLANKMVKNTIDLANEFIEDGEKVMIVCCFENEVKQFKEYYKDKAVVYDGKKTVKQKDKAEYEFMNNPSKKVFIGQIIASGVGLTLTASHICIFNSFSWVPSDNWQVMDRVHRLSQTHDVSVYYQIFDDENSINMWNKIINKENIIKEVIKSEKEK